MPERSPVRTQPVAAPPCPWGGGMHPVGRLALINFAGLYARIGIWLISLVGMAAHNEAGRTANLASGAGKEWLGNSLWHSPDLRIQRVNSWGSITALTYRRGSGEATWRGDRHRLVFNLE